MSVWEQTARWLTDPAHWTGHGGVLQRLAEHVTLTAVAVALACALALPVALWLGHVGRGGALAVNVSNVGRAVPTFAVLVLLAVGPLGIGTTSTVVALTAFAVPPILTNTYVGMREVDPDVREAARGMGMSGWQLLVRVELPLARPLLMAGLRVSVVQVVATATIAALIGGGGLGRFVVDGFAQQDHGQLIGGALLVAVLALVLEGLLALAQRLTDPMRGRRGPALGGPDAATAPA